MGRLSSQETTLQHFSHVHPLQLYNMQQQEQAQCDGCQLPCTGLVYRCTSCNYILHKSCTQIPNQIKHPSHPQHSLTLLATPLYFHATFTCDGCGKLGTSFSFHCATCQFDLHVNCASCPRVKQHQAHPHPLNLSYTPPYGNVLFSCDICRGIGSLHWVYRCAPCGFDAHLGCVISNTPQPQPQPQFYNQQQPRGQGSSMAQPTFPNPLLQGHMAQPMFVNPLQQDHNDFMAQIMPIIQGQRQLANQMIQNEIQRNYSQQWQNTLQSSQARPIPSLFHFNPVSYTAPIATDQNNMVDSILQDLAQMSVNNNNNDNNDNNNNDNNEYKFTV
ncbi:uncharacterized protein LOC143886746 [Tasmannia lanceolata]|uniref:uncharacterized protein LOC143886746 n=1 Tax=Tasmannia lanceolata TaxID=3420 RepID=UPI004062811E